MNSRLEVEFLSVLMVGRPHYCPSISAPRRNGSTKFTMYLSASITSRSDNATSPRLIAPFLLRRCSCGGGGRGWGMAVRLSETMRHSQPPLPSPPLLPGTNIRAGGEGVRIPSDSQAGGFCSCSDVCHGQARTACPCSADGGRESGDTSPLWAPRGTALWCAFPEVHVQIWRPAPQQPQSDPLLAQCVADAAGDDGLLGIEN